MSYINFCNIQKKYGNSESLSVNNFNLEINKGEFIVFVGPSGCGKSTTLRMIAGLEEISSGEISIDGIVVNDVEPKDRNIAMVFQNYALYPHLNVADNITLALKVNKVKKEIIEEKLLWGSTLLGLETVLLKKPKELSGGQRQRVALGRAIVRNPKVFLMDEPLSNLDAKLRVNMRNEITKLHKKLSATTIYVTHDQIEAMTMADRIVVMNKGEIQQIGTPLEIYNNPKNKFVAGFIGSPNMNFIDIVIKENQIILPTGFKIEYNTLLTGNYLLGVRPDDFVISESGIELDVLNVEKMGNVNNVFTNIHGSDIIITLKESVEVGNKIKVTFKTNNIHLFDIESGENILC